MNYPALPVNRKHRTPGLTYWYQGEPRHWDGKYLRCKHGKIKPQCRACQGSAICPHGKIKPQCGQCQGCSMCPHGRVKHQCKRCLDPDKYQALLYRLRCNYYKHRGYQPGDIRIKHAEQAMVSYLTQRYPTAELILGETVGNLCTESRTHRFPDVRLWWRGFCIVFECDEYAHRGESYDCDYKRMNEICVSLFCPVWFIRWNPQGGLSLDALGQTADTIMRQQKVMITWKYRNQFNVTYVGYSAKDLDRQQQRESKCT